MYSLMFPLPLYLIEMRFAKSVLVSDFSFLANLFLISSRNSVRPEKFQFLEKGQNRNFDYKIVISVKNSKFIL